MILKIFLTFLINWFISRLANQNDDRIWLSISEAENERLCQFIYWELKTEYFIQLGQELDIFLLQLLEEGILKRFEVIENKLSLDDIVLLNLG